MAVPKPAAPVVWLRLMVLAAALFWPWQSLPADDTPVFAGDPVPSRKLPAGAVQILENPGFRVGYSEASRQPLWVGFRAESVRGKPPLGARPAGFSADTRLAHPVSSRDYASRKNGGRYTRGHLAPNYLIGKLYGRAGQLATFLMSNVSPQSRRLNELLWQRLEEAEIDVVAPAMGQLYVLTGPLFGDARVVLRSGIPVPEAFFRIWLDLLPSGEPRALAFIVPQDVCGTEPLSRYLTTIDEVERRTQLDFYAPLENALEDRLEASTRTDGWNVQKFDRLAPRYAGNFESLKC